MTPIPHAGITRTVARLDVDGAPFEVTAYESVATELNALGRGARVAIEGRLIVQRWKTADGTEHSRIEILAERARRDEEPA